MRLAEEVTVSHGRSAPGPQEARATPEEACAGPAPQEEHSPFEELSNAQLSSSEILGRYSSARGEGEGQAEIPFEALLGEIQGILGLGASRGALDPPPPRAAKAKELGAALSRSLGSVEREARESRRSPSKQEIEAQKVLERAAKAEKAEKARRKGVKSKVKKGSSNRYVGQAPVDYPTSRSIMMGLASKMGQAGKGSQGRVSRGTELGCLDL